MHHAVLFDMDGVLVDTDRAVAEFWQGEAALAGVFLTAPALDSHVYGRPAEHTLHELFPWLPPERHHEVYDRMRENDQSQRYTAITGVLDLIDDLVAGGIPVALVTGAEDTKVVAVVNQLGLDDAFDARVCAGDVAKGKPDPACYRLAAERLDVDIRQCLVFEDAVSGVTSALAAGATCVALAPERDRARLLELGVACTVPDFTSVCFSRPKRMLHVGSDGEFPLTRPRTAVP
jgi:HAD superfamily hydrolase (TIGR01509 family)